MSNFWLYFCQIRASWRLQLALIWQKYNQKFDINASEI